MNIHSGTLCKNYTDTDTAKDRQNAMVILTPWIQYAVKGGVFGEIPMNCSEKVGSALVSLSFPEFLGVGI